MQIQFKVCPKCTELMPMAYLECTNCECSLIDAQIVTLDKRCFYEQWQDQKRQYWINLELERRLDK